jgi:hypothetical protein
VDGKEGLRVALTDPPKAGISAEIVREDGALGQTANGSDPLAMAKADAQAAGRIPRKRVKDRTVVSLTVPRPSQSRDAVYIGQENRDRLARLALIMSCSFAETIKSLSTLRYRTAAQDVLGFVPGEDPLPFRRDVRVRADMDEATVKRWEKIARDCHLGRAKRTAAMALDRVLGGFLVPRNYDTLEEAAEGLRRNPVKAMQDMASQLDAVDGRILMKLSPQARQGIIAIMNDFDRRRDWSRVRFRRVVEGLADLQVSHQLVGDIAALRRAQQPLVLPMWAIEKLSDVAMKNLLVSQPAFRRPSSLVSETLEYIGQGAIKLIHQRKGTDSLETLREFRRGGRQ